MIVTAEEYLKLPSSPTSQPRVLTSQQRKQYGISQFEYEELWKFQDGRCQICRSHAPRAIDHCHKSGKVRGLLCTTCNLGLGSFKDRPELLEMAIYYLAHPTVENMGVKHKDLPGLKPPR